MAPKLNLKLGAEPGKVVILGALLLLAAYLFYSNVLAGPDIPEQQRTPARPAAKAPAPSIKRDNDARALTAPPREMGSPKSGPREFRPSLKPRKGEEESAAVIDPTLRLDLLAKLAEVRMDRADRSLFDFSSNPDASLPKQPEPKIEVKKPEKRMIGPELPPPPPPPVVKPPPPPIPLKFYGNALPLRSIKRVFCMQGEEVLTPAEGEVIQRRYKIIRINATSVLVEDLDYKNQQTLPIEEVPQSG
ncbi:MAG: hypothetical protein HY858_12930 [Candidatus Solibacter usitatus]|nr:hypothetical protein [Candidatus Solibacter usitatus]